MASPRGGGGGGGGGLADAAAAQHAERSDRLSRNLLANLRTLNESLASVRTSVAKIDALAQQRLSTTAGGAGAGGAPVPTVVARKPSTKGGGGSAVKGASAATTLPSALARSRSPSAASQTSRASAKSSASSRAGTPPPVGWSHHDASADAEVSAANEAWRRATGAESPATGLAAAFGGSRASGDSAAAGGGGASPSHSRHSSRHSRGGHSVHFHAADEAADGGDGDGGALIAPAAGSASPSAPVELQQQLRRSALRHSAVSAGTSGSEDERGARLRFSAGAAAVGSAGGRHRGHSAGDDGDDSSGGDDDDDDGDDGIEFDRQSERSSVRFRLPPTRGGSNSGGDEDDDDASDSGDSAGGGGDGSASARRRRVQRRPPPPVLRGSSGGSAPDSARFDAATVSSGGYADSVGGDDDDDEEEGAAAGAGGWAAFAAPRGSPGAGSAVDGGGGGSARKHGGGRSLGAQGKRRSGGSVRFAAAGGGGGSADSSMALDDDTDATAAAATGIAGASGGGGDIDAYEGDLSGLDADLEALLRQREEDGGGGGARGLSTASTAGSGSSAASEGVRPEFLVPSLEVAAAAAQMGSARELDGAQARHRAFQALLAVRDGRSPASPPLARQTSPSHLGGDAAGAVAAMVPAREAVASAFGVSKAAAGDGAAPARRRQAAAGCAATDEVGAADVRAPVAGAAARAVPSATAAAASGQLQPRVFRFKRYVPPARGDADVDDDGTYDDIPIAVEFVSEEAFRAAETEAEQMAQLRQRVASLSPGGSAAAGGGSSPPSSVTAGASGSGNDDPYVLTGADAEDPTEDVDALAAAIAGWHGGDVPWETSPPSPAAAAAAGINEDENGGSSTSGGGPRFEALSLRVVYRAGRTGFEETKDWVPGPGEVVAGRYRVREPLGSAAFSSAVSATDLVTGADVCLKIIKSNMDYFIQSIDEIKLLRYVNAAVCGGDPDAAGVLRLHDYFYHREHLLLVTELLKDNLYEFQRYLALQGAAPYFTGPRLRSIARQVLTSLAAIHGAGLIHCDLKPENILVKSYSRCEVKVIDFGSSCFVTDAPSSYIQSRSYRAPEVILGLAAATGPKIDVWSLGCILAELAAGRVLFANDSIQTMLARMMSLLGPLPRHMVDGGREARRYFALAAHTSGSDDGGASSPPQVVYERLPVGSEREAELLEAAAGAPPPARGYALLRPRRTSLAARLGGPSAVATGACAPDAADPGFLDFLASLLALDPAERPSAAQALRHPWLAAHGGPHEPIEPYVLPVPSVPTTAATGDPPADAAETA